MQNDGLAGSFLSFPDSLLILYLFMAFIIAFISFVFSAKICAFAFAVSYPNVIVLLMISVLSSGFIFKFSFLPYCSR